jgi:tetratricopeptide (TPR) repeat protein
MDTGTSTTGGLLSKRQLSSTQKEKKSRLMEAGHEAFDAEEYTRALDCYHRASVIDSADAEVWAAVGMAYANLDLPQEAWRSYKLAMLCDPDDPKAMWYAAEFLFNIEDFRLAKIVLERYISLEEDALRLEEAHEMLSEASRLIGDDDDIRDKPRFTGSDDLEEFDEEDEELEGFEVEDESSFFEDDEDSSLYDTDIEDEDSDQEFIASLNLELTGMRAKCHKCSTPLPLDAPYCYNCLAPHLYGGD